MAEPTSRDWMEIREWLVRIDTKVDYLTEVKTKAERAESKADSALLKAEDNAKAIDKMQTTTKWAIGLTVVSILSAASIVVAIAF